MLSLEGPVNTTFFAPAVMCLRAVSSVKNKPVASTATSTPIAPQLRFAGSRSEVTRIVLPFTTKLPSLTSTVPSKNRELNRISTCKPCIQRRLSR